MSNKGRVFTEEHKLKLKMNHVGFKRMKHSEESLTKMSLVKLGKKNTPEHNKSISNAKKGDKTNLWKGGVTPVNAAIRSSLEYRVWRKSVFERDSFTCIMCGRKRSKDDRAILNADHIKPFSLYPELRFDIDNGRTLCVPCHIIREAVAAAIAKI